MTWIQRYEYVKKHWPLAGWFLAVLFAYGYITKTCPEPVAAPVVVTQSQAVTQTAKASVTVKLVYRDRLVEVPGEAPRPLPCPEIDIQADSGTEATHWQSQAVTVAPKTALEGSRLALFAGGGYVAQPVLTLGLGYDRLRIQGLAGLGVYGGLLTWDVIK